MNKFNQKILACLMTAVLMILMSVAAIPIEAAETANGTCGENLTWTLDDNGTLTISGTGDMPLTRPWSEHSSKIITVQINNGVTSIGYRAFEGCSALTSITLPDSVTSIRDRAFYSCFKLTDIVLPEKLTSIGDRAFDSCSALTSITIPDSVTSIGNYAFKWCLALESITLPDSMTSIGSHAFEDCRVLKSITIPDGVTVIGDKTFYTCSDLENITLPDSVTNIGDYAFSCCYALTSIVIPDSVTNIGDQAFSCCSALENITLPDSVTNIGSEVFNITAYYNNDENWENNKVLYIGNHLIEAKNSIAGSYSIRPGTVTIAKEAFEFCRTLTGITLPDSVTSIGDKAFYECNSLMSIIIPDSVTSIERSAFHECGALTIYGYSGSYAQKYAKENNVSFMTVIQIGNQYFTDVTPGAWYESSVKYAVEHNLFYGVSDTRFAPDTAMNRAMLVTVLHRMEDKPKASAANPFKDVPSGEWYTDAVKWAAANGIVYGITNDKFDPTGNITREQMAAILYRYSQKKGYDVSKTADLKDFSDGDKTSDYAVTALSWAYGNGFITGVKKGDTDYLEPKGSATRAQVASILMRYQQNVANKK